MAASFWILFALVAVFNATCARENELVEYGYDHPRDCDCLRKLKRVVSDCHDSPCNDHVCGNYQLKKEYYLNCHCPVAEGGAMKKCCEHNPHFQSNFQDCGKDRKCSEKCITTYLHNHHKEIHECYGDSPCLKNVNFYLHGAANCSHELDHDTLEKYNSVKSCPCKPN